MTRFRPPPAGLAQAGPSSLHRSVAAAAAADDGDQDDEEDADGAEEDEELQF